VRKNKKLTSTVKIFTFRVSVLGKKLHDRFPGDSAM